MKVLCIILCFGLMGCSGMTIKEKELVDLGVKITWNHLQPKIKEKVTKLLKDQPELKQGITDLCISLQDMNNGKIDANKTAAYIYDGLKMKIKNDALRADITDIFNIVDFGTIEVSGGQSEILTFIISGLIDVLRD